MIAFPGMIADAAQKAGIKVPEIIEEYDADEFPHWDVFCTVQLCRPVVYHGEHWMNAKVIASIPEDKIRLVTLQDLIDNGLSWRS